MAAISGTIAALTATAATTASTAASATGGLLASAGGLTGVAAAGGAIASGVGAYMQYDSAQEQAALQRQAIKTETEAAKIEAARARRAVVRDTLRAQAMSEVAAGNGGAIQGSGVAGGIAQAANSGLQSQRDINQNLGTSLNLAGIRMAQSRASEGAATGAFVSSVGQGLQSLSSSLSRNQAQNQRVYGPLAWLYGTQA